MYPHIVPYPRLAEDLLSPIISHEETVLNQGTGAALAKLNVAFPAATALVVGSPLVDPTPTETEAGTLELEAYAGTTLVGSPSSDILSTPSSPVDSWSSVIYPHFDLYPAVSTLPSSIGNSPSSPVNDEFDSAFESSSGYDTGDLDDDDSDSGSATPKLSSARDMGACVTHVAKVVGLTLMKSELRI